MFPENSEPIPNNGGWVEVITGCMFSGKTEELIRRLKRAIIARQRVEIFKPSVDKRFSPDELVSHDASSIRSTSVELSANILMLTSNIDVVGIDEAQFFDPGLVDVCTALANSGIRVIVAGLDIDYLGKPFGPMPALLSIAEYVTKVHAICVRCSKPAHYSFRKSVNDKLVVLGAGEIYEPLCRNCYKQSLKDSRKLQPGNK